MGNNHASPPYRQSHLHCMIFNVRQSLTLNVVLQLHDKVNQAIDKALRANPMAPVLHRLNVRRPSQRRRPKPIKISSRLSMIDADCQVPPSMDRLQFELHDHFEHHGVSTQERSDLLRILTHPQASLQGLKYSSAKGLMNHIERDGFSDMPLIEDFWEGENCPFQFRKVHPYWVNWKDITPKVGAICKT